MLFSSIYFILFLGLTNAAVHKFLAHTYRLDRVEAEIRQNALKRMRFQQIREHWPEFDDQNGLQPSIALNHSETTYNLYLTNITVGTPAQTFVAEIDLWYGSDLCVISSSANLSVVDDRLAEKHTYNSSESSSFVDLKGKFADWVCGYGINGSDQVTVDTASANVAMGIVDNLGYEISQYPIDAMLGLNPSTPQSNKDNLVSQLVAGLDKPIVSWWQNESSFYEGPAQLTLGGEDIDNCRSNYVYAPQIPSINGFNDFGVHLVSASIDGMPNSEKGLNTTLQLWHGHNRIYCSDDFFYLMTNASNASWNETIEEWEVDCDVSKVKNITLNIGSNGNTTDSNTKQLVLTGVDYIRYYSWYDKCVVYAAKYKRIRHVEMTFRFLNNHCLAYNVKEKTVGFADAKWINSQLRTSPPPFSYSTVSPSTAQSKVQR
ncbi:eukaryotic aspartyl protease domain-containing protein [Ditylenchus destructor]|uniref:Eukaryotic aspartyl protease domain-containing protein n=1 Tax=Ditylenchus destructor TaxID=166010 RepID=A0AAD4QWM2_9BILA|nr:eukaryotic aspartyl protease domain-containing protein [Ditylenchus destructor]